MSAVTAPVAGPLLAGVQPRPAWRIRAFVPRARGRPGGSGAAVATACIRIPEGLASTPEGAIAFARQSKRFREAIAMLPLNCWRAFPVTEPAPLVF